MNEWFGKYKSHTKLGNIFRFYDIEDLQTYINEKFNTVNEE